MLVSAVPEHRTPSARALVYLHEHHLREFLRVWRAASEQSLIMPPSEDPDCASLDALLRHVLAAARGYITWSCASLGLDDPGISEPPAVEAIADQAESYAEHLLAAWRTPLRDVEEERFHRPEHKSRWGVLYCIDAMLEHAVMHPIRHAHQLRGLLGEHHGFRA